MATMHQVNTNAIFVFGNPFSLDDDTQPDQHDPENSSATDDNHLRVQIAHSLINSLSSSREKFPTSKPNHSPLSFPIKSLPLSSSFKKMVT